MTLYFTLYKPGNARLRPENIPIYPLIRNYDAILTLNLCFILFDAI